jgi:hypothetical protein
MPLSLKDFTEVLRRLPADASQDQIHSAAKAAEEGTPLEHLWNTVNRPLVGSEDALIPGLAHTHGADEGIVRRTAEDFGASLTSPVSLGTMALGGAASMAGKAGMLGVSQAARYGEAALQAPFAIEGARNVVEGETPGEKLAGAAQLGLAGMGMRSAMKHAFEPTAVRDTFIKERGLPKVEPEPFDLAGAKRTADAYEAMPHAPQDADVAASYGALQKEIKDQYLFLRDRAGLQMEPSTEGYASSKAMTEDVRGNNKLNYFPSKEGFGTTDAGSDHPLLQVDPDTKLSYNDMFRAVHDYFGHAVEGNQFGPKGEQAAYNAHRATLTAPTHGALTSETKGQNSWVNFGSHLRDAEGNVPGKGEPGFVPPQQRPFAEQKAGLLPEFRAAAPREILPSAAELADSRYNDVATGRNAASATSQAPLFLADASSRDPQVQLSPELLADVNSRHAANGGSSTDLKTGKGLTAQDAPFMLSPYEDRQAILDHPPTEQDLRNYIGRNEDLLTKPGHNLGTWNNEGKHYLDVSIGEQDRDRALALGKQHKQLAIFDMVNGKDIPVGGDEVAPKVGAPAPEVGNPHRDAELENIRRNAPYGEGAIMPSSVIPTELRNTAYSVIGPAAALYPGKYSDDPEQDSRIRKYLGASGVALGAAGFFPKDLKVKLDAVKQATMRGFKERGEIVRDAVVKTNIRKTIASEIADPKERTFLEGLYHTIPLPKYEGINFDERRPIQELLAKGRTNAMQFKKFTTNRLDTLYNVGAQQGSHWGNPDWIQKLTGGEPELAAKFARTLGALSPGTPTGWNAAQGAEVFVRHVLNGEPLGSVLNTMNTFGVQNRMGKELNLRRMTEGGRIFGEKTENLAASELGVKGRIPIDLWLLRAFGSHTDKTPGPKLYRAFEDAFTKYATAKKEDPFTVMAKVWTGIQKVAGAETPSWQKAFEQMGITENLTDDKYRDWVAKNLPTLSKKLLSFDGQQKFADDLGNLAKPPLVPKVPAGRQFGKDVETHMLQTQLQGDVLGKKTMTKLDRARLEAAMKKAGVSPKSDAPF